MSNSKHFNMTELTTYNLSLFNKHLLKFRIKYYFKETGELVLRHKLLMAFLFCLLAPGIEKIHVIGVPFFLIVAPGISLGIKLLSLTALLFFLFLLIRAQANSIKGGKFGDYLATLQAFSPHDKKIDLIVSLLSLNIIWFALFFGGAGLTHITNNTSYYALYSSLIIVIMIFILNVLYKNIQNIVFLTFLCMLIALASTQQNSLLNFGVCLFSSLSCIIIAYSTQPYKQKTQAVKTNKKLLKKSITTHPNTLYFLTQIATVRAHKAIFIIRLSITTLLSVAAINILLFSTELVESMFVVLLILIGIQTYILSTLSTFFSKNEQDYSLFHSIFHDNLMVKQGIEIICISAGLFLSLIPLMIFLALMKPIDVLLLTGIIITSMFTITINRMLYRHSLRFCFFTSLINTVANVVMQYLLIGAFLGT